MKKCVFFDRDGVVNVSPPEGYIERWADFSLMPGFSGVLRTVIERGYEAVIVTNQRGVALEVMSMSAVDDIHRRLRDLLLREYGLELLDIMTCPHDRGECSCRKPLPGMLVEAADRHGIDLSLSWMVGDQPRDIEAGRRAGCRTIAFSADGSVNADYQVTGMKELETLFAKVL